MSAHKPAANTFDCLHCGETYWFTPVQADAKQAKDGLTCETCGSPLVRREPGAPKPDFDLLFKEELAEQAVSAEQAEPVEAPPPLPAAKPPLCPNGMHDFEEVYYGTRCKKCGLFFPDGCAPWDISEEEAAEMFPVRGTSTQVQLEKP